MVQIRYFTIFYLIIDPSTGHFKYSCAGHPPAIILKKSGELELLNTRGLIIGLYEGLPFGEAEGILEEGDKVFLYTNGIIELENQTGEQVDNNRFYTLLKSLKNESINRIVQEVYKTLRNFSDWFQDDVSLLGFEREPRTKIK